MSRVVYWSIVGAPWIDGARLAADLHALKLPGYRARNITFQPSFHKHAGHICGGVQIHVTDADEFRSVATYLALVTLARSQKPDAFEFRTASYEFRDDVPAFDLLTGDAEARERILRGDEPMQVASAIATADSSDHALVTAAFELGRGRRI